MANSTKINEIRNPVAIRFFTFGSKEKSKTERNLLKKFKNIQKSILSSYLCKALLYKWYHIGDEKYSWNKWKIRIWEGNSVWGERENKYIEKIKSQ